MRTLSALAIAGLLGMIGASQSFAQMSVVNGASFDPAQPIASGSFAHRLWAESLLPDDGRRLGRTRSASNHVGRLLSGRE